MPLVAAKCTYCNADMLVDPSKQAAICGHCGTNFLTEKAISFHNISNNMYSFDSADYMYYTALNWLNLGNSNKCIEALERMIDKFPDDKRGWQKLALLLMDAQIEADPALSGNTRMEPASLEIVLHKAESFGGGTFLEEIRNRRKQLLYNQEEVSEGHSESVVAIFSDANAPTEIRHEVIHPRIRAAQPVKMPFGGFLKAAQDKLGINGSGQASFGGQRFHQRFSELDELDKYCANRMREMFEAFGISRQVLDDCLGTSKNTWFWSLAHNGEKEGADADDESIFCRHLLKYCGLILNLYWSGKDSEQASNQKRDSIAYWLRAHPYSIEAVENVFQVVEKTRKENLCPYCGGKRNPLSWITDKFNTCHTCKRGYIWDFKHYISSSKQH
ncbi:MAG: hypothetical protein FWG10_06715 [Eubacteriaceae bacterium]|nr:hypothetical protein [Eubacteriaceae bacterium]